jgi:hypothetical protein
MQACVLAEKERPGKAGIVELDHVESDNVSLGLSLHQVLVQQLQGGCFARKRRRADLQSPRPPQLVDEGLASRIPAERVLEVHSIVPRVQKTLHMDGTRPFSTEAEAAHLVAQLVCKPQDLQLNSKRRAGDQATCRRTDSALSGSARCRRRQAAETGEQQGPDSCAHVQDATAANVSQNGPPAPAAPALTAVPAQQEFN